MAKVGQMQGIPAHIVTLKSDGRRRHPAHCIFSQGKGKNRCCTNEQCPVWGNYCRTASKCDYYEEKEVENG